MKPRPEEQTPCHSSFCGGDHLWSTSGIICGLGIICGRGSFAALYRPLQLRSRDLLWRVWSSFESWIQHYKWVEFVVTCSPCLSLDSLVFHVGYIKTKTKEHHQMRSWFLLFKPDELTSLRIIDLCIYFWSGQYWDTLQFCFLSLTSDLFSFQGIACWI